MPARRDVGGQRTGPGDLVDKRLVFGVAGEERLPLTRISSCRRQLRYRAGAVHQREADGAAMVNRGKAPVDESNVHLEFFAEFHLFGNPRVLQLQPVAEVVLDVFELAPGRGG